jgi:hypothetical protein
MKIQMKKKKYTKPIISKILLDYTVSLNMLSQPGNPPPRGGGSKGGNSNDPFKSPFGGKPFG